MDIILNYTIEFSKKNCISERANLLNRLSEN